MHTQEACFICQGSEGSGAAMRMAGGAQVCVYVCVCVWFVCVRMACVFVSVVCVWCVCVVCVCVCVWLVFV
jgi:hypothetical protein